MFSIHLFFTLTRNTCKRPFTRYIKLLVKYINSLKFIILLQNELLLHQAKDLCVKFGDTNIASTYFCQFEILNHTRSLLLNCNRLCNKNHSAEKLTYMKSGITTSKRIYFIQLCKIFT